MLFADLMLLAFVVSLTTAAHFANRLTPIELERDQAKQARDEAQEELKNLHRRLENQGNYDRDLDKLKREIESERAEKAKSEAQRRSLTADLEKLEAQRRSLTEVLEKTEELRRKVAADLSGSQEREKALREEADKLRRTVKDKEAENQTQKREADKARQELEQAAQKEKGVHQELLGLKSKKMDRLGKVALLVDTSGSMDTAWQGKVGGGKSRWKVTKDTIRTWFEHLGADEVVLIRFHNVAEKGRVFNLNDPNTRKQLSEEIDTWKPEGVTATYDALMTAYTYEDLDAMILFTDGAPTDLIEGRNTGKEAIYQLLTKHRERRIPINVVAVGQYFDTELSSFLLELARLSDGAFQGR